MIVKEDFSIDELVRKMKKPEMGAIVTFLGFVRADEGVKGMTVEADKGITEKALKNLEREARERFNVEAVEIVQREGSLKVGENIVVILVGAKHRKEAFRACEFLIDELNVRAPLRKEEF